MKKNKISENQAAFLINYAFVHRIEEAANMTGINRQTVYTWLEEDENGNPLEPTFVKLFTNEKNKVFARVRDLVLEQAEQGNTKILLRLLDSKMFTGTPFEKADKIIPDNTNTQNDTIIIDLF